MINEFAWEIRTPLRWGSEHLAWAATKEEAYRIANREATKLGRGVIEVDNVIYIEHDEEL